MRVTVLPTAAEASSSVPCASVMVMAEAASRLPAPSMTLCSEVNTCAISSMSRRALDSFSSRPSAMSCPSRPMALNTEPAVVRASATFSRIVVLICSCTAVLALPVILGAMAFFFSFS